MKALGISVFCPVEAKRRAILDPRYRVFLNQEAYFFSGRRALKRFLAAPLRYCGQLRDPVTQLRFQPTPHSPRLTFKGRDFYFASTETQRAFEAAPESLSVRREE